MRRLVLLIATAVATLLLGAQALAATGVAPGAPGAKSDFAPADKHGFGTSRTLASKVWFTLESGELTEVYYPRLDTPSYRDLQFVVTDGHSFAEREQDSTVQRTVQTDPRQPHLPPGEHRQGPPLEADEDLRHRSEPDRRCRSTSASDR